MPAEPKPRTTFRPALAAVLIAAAALLHGPAGGAPAPAPAPAGPAGGDGRKARAPEPDPAPILRTELVFVVKVTGTGEDVRVEVPLPGRDDRQEILEEEFRLRGFELEEVERHGQRLAVLTYPELDGRKRFTYKALVETRPERYDFVSPQPGEEAPRKLRRWTVPTPRLQSRSPLVRERLIRHLEPRLRNGDRDLVPLIYGMVAQQFEQRRGARATSNVLKAVRTGTAGARGLDRVFVTFLRAAGIPARSVTGFRLGRDGGRHLVRWTEAWLSGRWVPFSVPEGWYGYVPGDVLAIRHGEGRLLEREGVERLSFRILVRDPRPGNEVAAPPQTAEASP